MKKIYKSLIISFILLSIGIYYLIVEEMYNTGSNENDFNFYRYKDNLHDIRTEKKVEWFFVNSYDSVTTYFENLIIWLCMFWGLWKFFDILPYLKKTYFDSLPPKL